MDDIFIENLVKKRNTASSIAMRIIIMILGGLLAVPFLYLSFTGFFSGFMVLLAIGSIYGAYRLAVLFNIEFETSFTNGLFDVDKIINKSSRKRLISVQCKDVIEMGVYKPEQQKTKTYKTRIIACDSELSEDVWFLVTNHSTLGRSLVVFNMTDKLMSSFKSFVPREVAFTAFGGRF